MDPYFWTSSSGQTVQEFIKKYRPSMVESDVTPWIWVQGTAREPTDPDQELAKQSKVLREAQQVVENLLKRLEEIEMDDSIPVRGKKGAPSKKAVRDEAHEGTTAALKDLSIKNGWTSGKWMMFPRHESVDDMWSSLAQSVASGPLKAAGVSLCKVASTPKHLLDDETWMLIAGFLDQPVHVICLYMDDIYDLSTVRQVLETLLTEHGMEPSAAKSDLYTLAGIDSHHPTKLRSSIWRPKEVIEGGDEAIQVLKAKYKSKKPKVQGSDGDGKDEGGEGADEKKRKSSIDAMGFIASDSEDERVVAAAKLKSNGKVETSSEKKSKDEQPPAHKRLKKSAALLFKENDIFAGDDDDED